MLPALVLSLLISAPPEPGERELSEAIAHMHAFHEEKAFEALKHARQAASGSPEVLARVHLVTGLVHAQLAQERQAVDSFSAAIKLDRDIEPSAEDTSPKVLEWFNRARRGQGLPPIGEEKPVVEKPKVEQQQPQIVYVPAPVEPPPEPSRVPLYIGIGVAAAGAVAATAGLVFGMRAKAAEQEANIENDVTRYTALHRDAERDASTANALFLTSAVLGVGGGVVIGLTF